MKAVYVIIGHSPGVVYESSYNSITLSKEHILELDKNIKTPPLGSTLPVWGGQVWKCCIFLAGLNSAR